MPDLDQLGLRAIYGGADGRWSLFMIAMTVIGSGWMAILLVPLLLRPRSRAFAIALGGAIVAQATLVRALKETFGRVRPWKAFGWPAPIGTPSDPSFPSGHAAGSFCVAAFLAVALPVVWDAPRATVRAVSAALWLLAGLIALSRVYLGAHFPSDVATGAVLGAASGVAAAVAFKRRRAPPANRVEDAAKRG